MAGGGPGPGGAAQGGAHCSSHGRGGGEDPGRGGGARTGLAVGGRRLQHAGLTVRRVGGERIAGRGVVGPEPHGRPLLLQGERGGRVVVLSLRDSPGEGGLVNKLVQEGFESSDRLQIIEDLGLVEHGERSVSDLHQPVSSEVDVDTVDVVEHDLDVGRGLGQDGEGLYGRVPLLGVGAHPLVRRGGQPHQGPHRAHRLLQQFAQPGHAPLLVEVHFQLALHDGVGVHAAPGPHPAEGEREGLAGGALKRRTRILFESIGEEMKQIDELQHLLLS